MTGTAVGAKMLFACAGRASDDPRRTNQTVLPFSRNKGTTAYVSCHHTDPLTAASTQRWTGVPRPQAWHRGFLALAAAVALACTAAAAQSWEVSPDGLAWTFHLREGLRWSNGEPLGADDFVQSWRRMLLPAFAAEYAYLLYPIKNAEAFNAGRISDPGALGITAPDARTVRIELARPTPYLPAVSYTHLDVYKRQHRSSAW